MAPPHYSTEDFVYDGMYIPKNTAIVLNCYNIHHNEEKYPDPYESLSLIDIFMRKMS
jgi:cytochrome P450